MAHTRPRHVEYIIPAMYPKGHIERVSHEQRYEHACEYAIGTVADAACGFGYGTEMLSHMPRVNKVYGYDRNETALWNAQRAYPACSFMVADLDVDPPLKCDTLVTIETIEHLEDPFHFVATMKRRVAHRVFLTTPVVPTMHRNPWHKHDFTVDLIVSMFDDWVSLHRSVVNGSTLHAVWERAR